MVGTFDAASPLVMGDPPEEVRRKMAMDEVRRSLAVPGGDEAGLRKAVQGFEAIFIGKLWEEMRKNVPQEGYMHSRQEQAYLSMFEREMSVKMAESGGIGLGDMLFDQLRDQLAKKASGTRSRSLPTPDLVSATGERKGIPLEAAESRIKSLEDARRVKSLEAAGLVLRNMSGRSLGPAETAEAAPARLEPDFNPLADTDPLVGAAATAAPEIMSRAMNLASRIEMARLCEQASALDTGARPMPEGMCWPVEGQVNAHYGWRVDEKTGERTWKPGLEIAAEPGGRVKAGWAGTVTFAGMHGETGNTVVVEHADGWRSVYGNLDAIDVKVGDKVDAGSIIASMEGTGKDSPAALYFEVRRGEQAWDPESLREPGRAVASVENRQPME